MESATGFLTEKSSEKTILISKFVIDIVQFRE